MDTTIREKIEFNNREELVDSLLGDVGKNRILVKFKIFKETEKTDLVKFEGYGNIYRLRVGNYRVKIFIDGRNMWFLI